MNFWVYTTYKCNCACPYCYAATPKTEFMSEKNMEFFLKVVSEDPTMEYRLTGGEPLLAFDTYKDLVTKYQQIRMAYASLITNLTFLPEGFVDWINKNEFGLGVSLDSLTFSKPYSNGKSSSQDVIDNLKEITGYTKYKPSISSVITSTNYEDLEAMAEFVGKNSYRWVVNYQYKTLNDNELAEKIIEKAKKAILILKKLNYKKALQFCEISLRQKKHGCGAGYGLAAIGTNLEVWPCQMNLNDKPLGYFDKNVQDIFKTQTRYPSCSWNSDLQNDCKDCSIKNLCGCGCKITNSDHQKSSICLIRKEITKFRLQHLSLPN